MMSWIEYPVLRSAGLLLSHLPEPLDRPLFRVLWPLFRIIRRKELQRVGGHLEQASLRPRPPLENIYQNLWLNGLDSLRFLYRQRSVESRVHIVNRNLLQSLLNEHRPVVIISIHTGAFEMLHRTLTKFGRPVHLVASHPRRNSMDQFLRKTRAAGNLKIFRPDEAPRLLRDLIRKKGMLAMMVDQSRSGKGNIVDFLGRPNPLWLRLPIDASASGATLVTVRAMRKGADHVIRFETAYPPTSEPRDLIRKLGMEFERWVLENPEQWTWNYPRLWKTE